MIELTCRSCGHPYDVERRDLLRGPVTLCPTCREAMAPPSAECVVTWSERGRFWSVVVTRCPLCGGRHGHGAGDGHEPDLGHRQSHCLDRPGSYEMVETDESRAERARRAAA